MHNDNASAAGPDKSRRAFLILVPLGMLAGVFTSVATAAYRFLKPRISESSNKWIDVAPLADLTGNLPLPKKIVAEQIAGWATSTEEHFVYVLPAKNNQVLSAVCPHEGCEVSWQTASAVSGFRKQYRATDNTLMNATETSTAVSEAANPLVDLTVKSPGDRGDLFENGWGAWLQTTGGIVGILLLVQFLTGVLLAFYYVPSVDHAHTTVSFIEKVLPAGSWIRSLHHHVSHWLPVFLFLHIVRLFRRSAYNTATVHWIASVIVLALVMAAAATGYSLPWDARAFFSTRVAEGILSGLPLLGRTARLWALGGNEISTLTLPDSLRSICW